MANSEEVIQRILELLRQNQPLLPGSIDNNRIITLEDGRKVSGRALNTPIGREDEVVFLPQTDDGVPTYFYNNTASAPTPVNRNIRNLVKRSAVILPGRVQRDLYVIWTDNSPAERYAEERLLLAVGSLSNISISILYGQERSEYIYQDNGFFAELFAPGYEQVFTEGIVNNYARAGGINLYTNWVYRVGVEVFSGNRRYTYIPYFISRSTLLELEELFWSSQNFVLTGTYDDSTFLQNYLTPNFSAPPTPPTFTYAVPPGTVTFFSMTVDFMAGGLSVPPLFTNQGLFVPESIATLNQVVNQSRGWAPTALVPRGNKQFVSALLFTRLDTNTSANVLFNNLDPDYSFRWNRSKSGYARIIDYGYSTGPGTPAAGGGLEYLNGNTNWHTESQISCSDAYEYSTTDLGIKFEIDTGNIIDLTGTYSYSTSNSSVEYYNYELGFDTWDFSGINLLIWRGTNKINLYESYVYNLNYSCNYSFSSTFDHGSLSNNIYTNGDASCIFNHTIIFSDSISGTIFPFGAGSTQSPNEQFYNLTSNFDLWYGENDPLNIVIRLNKPDAIEFWLYSLNDALFSLQTYTADITTNYSLSTKVPAVIARGNNQILVLFGESIITSGVRRDTTRFRLPRIEYPVDTLITANVNLSSFPGPQGYPAAFRNTFFKSQTYTFFEGLLNINTANPWLENTVYPPLNAAEGILGLAFEQTVNRPGITLFSRRSLEFAGCGETFIDSAQVQLNQECYYSNKANGELLTINTNNTIVGRGFDLGEVTIIGNSLEIDRVEMADCLGNVAASGGYPSNWTRTLTRNWNPTTEVFDTTDTFNITSTGTNRQSVSDFIGEEFYFYKPDTRVLYTFTLTAAVPSTIDILFVKINGTITDSVVLQAGSFIGDYSFFSLPIVTKKNVVASFCQKLANGLNRRIALDNKNLFITYTEPDTNPASEVTYVHQFRVNDDGNITFVGEVEAKQRDDVSTTTSNYSRQYNGK